MAAISYLWHLAVATDRKKVLVFVSDPAGLFLCPQGFICSSITESPKGSSSRQDHVIFLEQVASSQPHFYTPQNESTETSGNGCQQNHTVFVMLSITWHFTCHAPPSSLGYPMCDPPSTELRCEQIFGNNFSAREFQPFMNFTSLTPSFASANRWHHRWGVSGGLKTLIEELHLFLCGPSQEDCLRTISKLGGEA